MLIEVKVKVVRVIDNKKKKCSETYITDKDFFTEAEYAVTSKLNDEMSDGTVDSFEIQSLRLSPIKEIAEQYEGEYSYIATLKDTFHDDNGNEKQLRYKVLLWANDLTSATAHTRELQHEGYDMLVEGLKEVNYTYLTNEEQ